MKNKIIIFSSAALLLSFVMAPSALAVCPVCAIAVGACVGLSRYLGVDDLISGVWVGGLLMSLVLWTLIWLKSKNYQFSAKGGSASGGKGAKIILPLSTFILYYGLTIIPLYLTNFIGHPYNRIWGIDKLLLGTMIGSIIFLSSASLYDYLKKKNNNKAYFPFQKVAMPLFFLGLASLIIHLLLKCKL